mmetsp:Transcript_10388/g.18645  ORF Transcript_10388/g.18645 Transcript_10388/m.18645 type:complete len:580 (+) Transcript_10388:137-1876(+)
MIQRAKWSVALIATDVLSELEETSTVAETIVANGSAYATAQLASVLLLRVIIPTVVASVLILLAGLYCKGPSSRGWVVTPTTLLKWLLHTQIVWGSTTAMAYYTADKGGAAFTWVIWLLLSPVYYLLSPNMLLSSLVAFLPWPRTERNCFKRQQNEGSFLKNIAVVVPCHKCAGEVASCLHSLLQYFQPQQILLVDNCSSETPPDKLKSVACAISPQIQYIFVPFGCQALAVQVGTRVMKNYKYVLLIDDDTELPENMLFDESLFANDDKMAGVAWSRDVIQHNILTRAVNFQLKCDDALIQRGLTYALGSTAPFLPGMCALYRREYLETIMEEHPYTHYGFDFYIGSIAIKHGFRMAFDSRSCIRTFSPPVMFGMCSSYDRTQGFAASSLFKQRAMRWCCTGTRNFPFIIRNIFTFRAGDCVSGICFRCLQVCAMMMRVPQDLFFVGGFLAVCYYSPRLAPTYLFVQWIIRLATRVGQNYILWYGSPDHQASLLTILVLPMVDMTLQVFNVFGALKCIFYDIWCYEWRTGLWKEYAHLEPDTERESTGEASDEALVTTTSESLPEDGVRSPPLDPESA